MMVYLWEAAAATGVADDDDAARRRAEDAMLANGARTAVVDTACTGGPLSLDGTVLSEASQLLDFSQPVAVLLLAVLHFIRDEEDPYGAAGVLKDAIAPGSAIAVSHITADGIGTEQSLAAQQAYQGASAPAVPRAKDEVTRFFDGLTLAVPGVTDIGDWPAPPGKPEEPGLPLSLYGGVGLKPKP